MAAMVIQCRAARSDGRAEMTTPTDLNRDVRRCEGSVWRGVDMVEHCDRADKCSRFRDWNLPGGDQVRGRLLCEEGKTDLFLEVSGE
jgi:hypothetical protein